MYNIAVKRAQQSKKFPDALIETGSKQLIHNMENDTSLGFGVDGTGQKLMGSILEKVRETLIGGEIQPDPIVCLFVCGISLTSGQLVSELFPDCTRSCFSQVVLRRMDGDRIYEMRCLFVAVGLNARFIVLPHWDNMS